MRGFGAASLLLAVLALTLAGFGRGEAVQKTPPFHPGEKFIYAAKWSSIPAGEASMEILPFTSIHGTKAFHFAMNVSTNAGAGAFYLVRDREDSYVDANMTHSLLYLKRDSGKYPRDIRVTYDWSRMTATRLNFGRTGKPVRIVPGTLDPVALFFALRTRDLRTGTVLEIPITDGKAFFVARAAVVRRETIAIGNEHYDTYVVVPDMERLGKALKEKGRPKLTIWFTADDRKIPVRIETRAAVGSITFDLQSATA
jgi:hypothetical protein